MSLLKSLVFFQVLLLSVSPELKKMREYYVLISENESSALALRELAKLTTSVPANISLAYYGAAQMALAKYKFNPVSQLNTFNTGKKQLETAVLRDTTSLEARYIRLSIQQNVPSFLNYRSNIANDRSYLIHNLKLARSGDPDLFSAVYAYLLTRCQLTETERTLLK